MAWLHSDRSTLGFERLALGGALYAPIRADRGGGYRGSDDPRKRASGPYTKPRAILGPSLAPGPVGSPGGLLSRKSLILQGFSTILKIFVRTLYFRLDPP